MTVYITNWGNQFIEDRFITSRVEISSLYKEFYVMHRERIEENLLSKADIVFLAPHYRPDREKEIFEIIEVLDSLGISFIFIPSNAHDIIRFGKIADLGMNVIDTSSYQQYSSDMMSNVIGLSEYHPVDKILEFKGETKNNTITVNFQRSPQSVVATLVAQEIAESMEATVLALDMHNLGLLSKCPNVLPIASISSEWVYQLIARSRLLVDFEHLTDNRYKIAANLLKVPCFTESSSNSELMVKKGMSYIESPDEEDLQLKHDFAKTLDISAGIKKIEELL